MEKPEIGCRRSEILSNLNDLINFNDLNAFNDGSEWLVGSSA